jgi:hypothetical protein
MVTTLRGRRLPSRLLRLMLQMMSRKPAAATKEQANIGNNIDVDLIDNFVIISSPLPAKQGGKKLNKPFFQHQTKQ